MCTLGVSVTGVLGRSSSFSEFTGYVSFFFCLQATTANLSATIPLLVFTNSSGSYTNKKKVEIDGQTDTRHASKKKNKKKTTTFEKDNKNQKMKLRYMLCP